MFVELKKITSPNTFYFKHPGSPFIIEVKKFIITLLVYPNHLGIVFKTS